MFLRWCVFPLVVGFALAWVTALSALDELDEAVAKGEFGHALSGWKRLGLNVAAQVLPLRQPGAAMIREGRQFRDCDDCPEMVEVQPGYALIGSPLIEFARYTHVFAHSPFLRQLKYINREGPRRLVRIRHGFALSRYELTLAEWDRAQDDPDWETITGRAPRKAVWPEGATADTVINTINQHDARAYAAWLSVRSGRRYRLPTEAQWAYAAASGVTTEYPWGDEIGVNMATCAECSDVQPGGHPGRVGLHPPNSYGIYDMIGNAWEWVEDCFVPWHDEALEEGEAHEIEACDYGVVRGGGAGVEPWQLRTSMRVGPHANNADAGATLRLLRELE
jgi:formylglycine-generating enzyme required for sulfatase activity